MKKRTGFLGSVEINRHGSQKLHIIYRPILLWICAGVVGLGLGSICVYFILRDSGFRLFAGVSCGAFLFLALDLLRHLGSVVELEFNQMDGCCHCRHRLFRAHWQRRILLKDVVRAEAIAPGSWNPKFCLLFTKTKPLYINLLFGQSPHRVVTSINQFLTSGKNGGFL